MHDCHFSAISHPPFWVGVGQQKSYNSYEKWDSTRCKYKRHRKLIHRGRSVLPIIGRLIHFPSVSLDAHHCRVFVDVVAQEKITNIRSKIGLLVVAHIATVWTPKHEYYSIDPDCDRKTSAVIFVLFHFQCVGRIIITESDWCIWPKFPSTQMHIDFIKIFTKRVSMGNEVR